MKLSSLLDSTPKWQHKDADVRLKAVATGNVEAENLQQLASTDPDLRVRLAALALVEDQALLITLAVDSKTEVKSAAVIRWSALKGDATELGELSAEVAESIVRHSDRQNLKLLALAAINDQATLASIMTSQQQSKIYQAIAERLQDEPVLQKIHKQFLDKDKNVAKITKQKLTNIKAKRARAESFNEEINRLVSAMEKLSISGYADDFERRLTALNERWAELNADALSEADEFQIEVAASTTFASGKRQCEATIAKVRADEEALEDQVNEILNRLFELTQGLRTSTDLLNEVPLTLKECRANWPQGRDLTHLYALTSPLEQLSDQYQQWLRINKELNSDKPAAVQKRLENIHWPDGFAKPEAIANALIEIAAKITEQESIKAANLEKQNLLDQSFKAVEKAIEDGHVKQANKLISNLKTKLEANKTTQQYQNQLTHFATKLKELRDWQGFATNPKREELCASMEALATDESIAPPEKANAIKELQEQWKKLGASDSRQGQKLWAKFKQLGDKAFEPCAAHFQEQRQKRTDNLEKKRQICETLESYFNEQDWDQANWKSVNELINKMRKEWRDHDDIQRSKRKKIFERYTKALSAVGDKLGEEQENNQRLKQGFIAKISELLESDSPLRSMIEETKRIQSAWKEVGLTKHQHDQKLWKQFRVECDKVFAKREESKQEDKKKSDAAVVEGRELLTAFKQYLDSETVKQGEINKFRKQFDQIEFKQRKNPLQNEWQKLTKQARLQLDEQIVSASKNMMEEFKRKAELCQQLESDQLDPTAFEAAWISEIELDKDLGKRIEQRKIAATQGKNNSDIDAEMLCVRLEILADIDSPSSSQQKRMAYQVERLNRELSQGQKETRSPREQAGALQLDWYCLSSAALNAESATDLNDRFARAEAKLGI